MTGAAVAAGGFGSFLLAVYDAEAEEYQSISKIGTGFSEELLKSVSAALQAHIIDKPPRYYRCAPLSKRVCSQTMPIGGALVHTTTPGLHAWPG